MTRTATPGPLPRPYYGPGRRSDSSRAGAPSGAGAILGRREVGARDARLRRGLRSDGRPTPALPRADRRAGVVHAGRDRPARAAAEDLAGRPGHHLHGLRREGGDRAHLPLRLRPAHRPGPRVGAHRGGADPAGHRAQPLHRRRLPGPEVPQGRNHPGRAGPLPQGVQARAAAGDATAPDLHARGRHRPGPGRPRRLPGPRGQLPVPERRVLRAGKPQPPAPGVPGVLHPVPGAAHPRLSPAPARHLAVVGAPGEREPGGRGADAGDPQRGLLRALVPRPRDGRVPGGRPRPPRRGQPRLHAHDRRPPAGGRDLPPGRRGFPRSAHLPP